MSTVMARVTRRAAWPTLSLTLLALLAVLGVLLLTGNDQGHRAGFTVRTQPSVIALTIGDSAEFSVTISADGGFAGTVTLIGTPLPPGVELSYDQPSLSLTDAQPVAVATGRLRTSSAAVIGAAAIQVIARSGHDSQSASTQTSVVQLQLQPADLTNPAAPPPATGPGGASFTVYGSPQGTLAPGATLPIDLRLVNGNPFALDVDSLTVAVASTSRPGCGAGNFAVLPYRGGYPLQVPAETGTSLSALRVPAEAWPQLRMLDLPGDQKACKGVTVNLRYAGTGSGA